MSVTVPDYPAFYVELDVNTDEQQLADGAIANLQATWMDWEPSDGNLEVVLIETISPMAAVAAENMAQMTEAAFIALGTKLYGIPYQDGAPASTTVTITFQDAAGGYDVSVGSEFDLMGYAFQTVDYVPPVAAGITEVAGVNVVANDVGVAFNGLTSADWSNATLPVWVTDLATEAPTSGGEDPQDDNDYLNMLSRELQLRGRMVVTLPDYELVAIDTPGIGRAYAVTTAARDVTVTVTDPQGHPVSSTIKDTLAATYATERLVNVTVAIDDATYTTINIGYSVMCIPGFDPAGVESSCNGALTQALDPGVWGSVAYGQPGSGPSNWVNDNTVRLNKMIAVVGSTPGVQYVQTLTINGSAADLVMPGTVALPQPGTMTGTVNTS
jgi:hypothetical protein